MLIASPYVGTCLEHRTMPTLGGDGIDAGYGMAASADIGQFPH